MPSEASALFGWDARQHSMRRKIQILPPVKGIQHIVNCCGIGVESAQIAVDQLLANGVSAIVNLGIAGGLDTALKTGYSVIASEALLFDMNNISGPWQAEYSSATRAQSILESERIAVSRGPILTSKRPILTGDFKVSLFKQTGALVVDMESAVIARSANQANIPFFGLRTVCDSAHVTVPSDVLSCLDQNGNIQIVGLLRSLVQKPAQLIGMLQLCRLFINARKALGCAWRILVEKNLPQALIHKS